MKRKLMFGAITIVALMIFAAAIIPIVKNDGDSENLTYDPRTIVIDNNSFSNMMETMFDDVSGEYSYDSEGNTTYDRSIEIKDVFPNSPDSVKNIHMDILVTYTDDKPVVTYDIDSDTFDQTKLTSEIQYDDNGNIEDVICTYEGVTTSLKDIYDPFDDCFLWFAAIPIIYYVAAITAAAIVVACVVEDGGTVGTDLIDKAVEFYKTKGGLAKPSNYESVKWEEVTDGIFYSEKDGKLISVSVNGSTCSVADLVTNPNSLEKNNYHYALLFGGIVYITPNTITKSTAIEIMKLKSNYGGRNSVWTYFGYNAIDIASTYGPAVGPEIGNKGLLPGYYWHYHTNNRQTDAHAFYGYPTI